MEYYSAIKKGEIMPFAATWMDLEIVMLSEISQTENKKYRYDIPCKVKVKVAQSCLTLCNPMDYTVHGIL